jgi:hypothetical protein
LRDGEWDYLEDEYYIEEIIRNPSSRNYTKAVEKVRYLRRKIGTQNEPKNQETRMLSEQEARQPSQRSEIISSLVAQEATQDAGVRLFRTEMLDDKYLPLEEIEEWIQQQAQKDGPSTNWLSNIPISRMKEDELMKQMLGITPDTENLSLEIPINQIMRYISQQIHLLQYPGLDGWERSIPTAVGGVLEYLRELGDGLAKKYKWSNQQATAFILTGRIPLISPINITLQTSSRALSSRIVLDIDPTLSPAEVARHYRRSRKKMIATHHRNLSEKHMQLAIFNSMRPDNETWAIKMDEWNKTQQVEWKYKTVSNFAHDCIQARNRLLRVYATDLAVFGQQGLPH